ncbi:fatty acyl-CoA reductase 1-like isoform X1 [Phragmites australis]|uniref:fatty acyl-CoA reductase 1-like isoform X1 n=1 Tax=Phragmites australis TaxID=29695 RepID=UPI002D78BF50|nr:fatty acyl-CoA reductase 1-like isoform X1 [Phragmites australis]XP_062199923.1 fatty acyl-CoA reductase 1-like isoform X1 [Phragmites australis]XP_062199924.1 fatty acyl-CoA reductase 1-like isoform X1 [Phragmites australis]
MELAGVAERLRNKTVVITGATGFIAKLLVEKILRLQPGVKKLYLLVRAGDQVSAEKRVKSEILQLKIFRTLQGKYQKDFSSWFWDKVFPVAGDVSLKNLGIGDVGLAEDMLKETNIIVHMAAAVNFRERYDTALAINTVGVKRVIEFASRCAMLELLLLVSTAYVNGKEAGVMLEKPLHQYRNYDGRSDLDISEEMAFAEAKLKELVSSNASEDTIRRTMKKIGTQRAQKFGWMNTYVFTKAMGEMLAYEHRSQLPIVIFRPTATTSTWKEPFPGWIEGIKTIDTWVTNYGKGHLKFLPGDVTTIIDIVPADIVVNAMLCIIGCQPQQSLDLIYQIGSSMRNPLKIGELVHAMYRYFSEKPFIGAEGDVIEVEQPNMPATMASFYEQMDIHYKVPLQDMVCRGLSTTDDHDRYNHLEREYNFTVAVAQVYRSATFFKRRFDDSNMQRLMATMNERDRKLIPCDTKFINWEKYLTEIHFPGVMECESREATRARL